MQLQKSILKICLTTALSATSLGVTTMASAACSELYNHQFKTLQGKDFNLCDYQDKPIIVVNTASKCGFTPQFDSLEKLYSQYEKQGLLVIGFPSNDFKQDPGDNKQIGDFCKMTYGVNFPMMAKSSVTGTEANSFYKQLIAKTGQAPKWNFYKYVISPQGKQVSVYESTVVPDAKPILDQIKPFLK